MLHELQRSRFVRPREPLQELLALQHVALAYDTNGPNPRDRLVDRRTLTGQLAALQERGFVRTAADATRYELTDDGRVRLQMLTVDFARELAALRAGTLEMLRAAAVPLVLDGVRRLVLYPFGETTEITCEAVDALGLEVIGIVDDAPSKWGVRFRGIAVQPASWLSDCETDAVLVTSALFRREILERARGLVRPGVRVHAL
jgi:hypothetical protein